MRKMGLVSLLVLLVVCLTISVAGAKEKWVSFGEVQKDMDTTSKAKVLKSDNNGISLNFDFAGIESIDVVEDGTVYQTLYLPNGGHRTEVGSPEVPMYAEYVEIPYDTKVTVVVEDAQYSIVSGYDVYPAQHPMPEVAEVKEVKTFVKDQKTYSKNAFYPANIAEINEEMIVRGHRLIRVAVYPVQVNPVTREMKVYSNVKVKVQYDTPKKIQPVSAAKQSKEFDDMLQKFVINFNDSKKSEGTAEVGIMSTGAEYLIITHDDYYTYANNLATWKTQKGLSVNVTKRSDIGTSPTATDITNYITNAYNTWSPAPTYVLIIGDADKIPVHYKTLHPYDSKYVGTDLYYAAVDGTDYYPDLYIGRLPVDSTTEANVVVNKILDYDKALSSNATWYNKMFYPGYFQDDNKDGREDRQFVLTNYKILTFMETKDYLTEIAWTHTDGTTPSKFYDGTTIPAWVTWMDDTTATNAVINAINAGKCIVNHRDHGASRNAGNSFDGWGDPYFTTTHVTSNLNNTVPPIIISTNCLTGYFDSETDGYTTRDYECLGEVMLQTSGKGCPGFLGATRVSYSGYNDELAKGYFDSMFQDFLTYTGSTSVKLGNILNHGKMYMASKYSEGTYRKIEFEMFHVLGDPEMAVRLYEDIYDGNTKYVDKAAGKNKTFRLNITTAGTYTISTNFYSASCDTVLYLYDHKWTQIATDDDGGPDLYSLITQYLGVGTYYIKVIEYGENAALKCTLSVN